MDLVCLFSLAVSLIAPNSFNAQKQSSSFQNGVDPTYSATVEPGLFYTYALFKGDIGLSTDAEAADYLLGNYEPLVVNETFTDGGL